MLCCWTCDGAGAPLPLLTAVLLWGFRFSCFVPSFLLPFLLIRLGCALHCLLPAFAHHSLSLLFSLFFFFSFAERFFFCFLLCFFLKRAGVFPGLSRVLYVGETTTTTKNNSLLSVILSAQRRDSMTLTAEIEYVHNLFSLYYERHIRL